MSSALANYFNREELPMEVDEKDIKDLAKSKRKMILLPLGTFGITYLIRNFRDKIFVSGNFLVNIMNVRGKYKNDSYNSKSVSQSLDEARNSEDPYKMIKAERELAKKNLKDNSVEKITKSKVVYKSNPDPFAKFQRQQGITPATKMYSGNKQSESFQYKSEAERSAGLGGNQIMNKGSTYTNMLKTYTDYQQNERFKTEKFNAEERQFKREKRFKIFKKINVMKIRDLIMAKRLKNTGSLFIIIPTVLAVFAGISQYATTSFMMYLKYQPMVDMYYLKQVEEAEATSGSQQSTSSQQATA
ncbi:unnamed protein product [Moneuplotes crassus]|uniref:Uncharacterized protein n=1 Tax=Euplotes crassus TaxID=5936 RepID=A0AAD1XPM2_EUPCR|nr:unnamed protein product [Moneuplotes crassus]